MEQFLGALPTLDRLGSVATFILFAALVITNKLIWYTRYEKLEKDRDKWQHIAISALTGPAQAGVRAAEVAVGVVQAIPDPQGDHESAGKG